MSAVASVVVPAHDEEAVIARTLDALLAGAAPGEFEVVVVANGCSDSTVDRAREVMGKHPGSDVRVLDLPALGKAGALAAGDRACRTFPRVFLDADVVVSAAAVRATAAVLDSGALVAAPRLRIDLSRCPWQVRAYYRVWLRLPVLQRSYVGSGFYAVSAAGRQRLGDFPDLVADDQWVRTQFADGERANADGEFVVRPPRTLRGLVRRGVRVRAGNTALRAVHQGASSHSGGQKQLYAELVREPSNWAGLVIYTIVHVIVRLRARHRVAAGRGSEWTRDETARSA